MSAISRLLLGLLLVGSVGCGSLSDLSGSATLSNGQLAGNLSAPIPGIGVVQIQSDAPGLRGPLPTLIALVDYADAACPYTESQASDLGRMLDAFIVRNSTGACWVPYRVARITLPGNAADYDEPITHDDATLAHPVQQACLAATEPSPYTLWLLPSVPRSYIGGRRQGRGVAWVAALEADPLRLPVPHEFGHALGLPHGPGVMSADNPVEQSNWNGLLDRGALGWLR